MKLQYLAIVVFLVFSGTTFMAHAQQYHIVPSGDPQNPYRIEQIVPPDTRDVATFDEAVQTARSLEGIDPGATAEIMQDPANPVPFRPCSLPDGTIWSCDDEGLTVK